MAGLLSDILGLIDRAKQSTRANVGLLMDNPQEYGRQINESARDINRQDTLAVQGQNAMLSGMQPTPEQMAAMAAMRQRAENLAMGFAGTVTQKGKFDIFKNDASTLFGAGSQRIKYVDSKTGGTIEVLAKPDGTASILGLEVPEQFRGMGIGKSLQRQVMQDFPQMQGQVSSKAAAKTAFDLGRRPVNNPNATLNDVFKAIDEFSSVNLVSPKMQERFR